MSGLGSLLFNSQCEALRREMVFKDLLIAAMLFSSVTQLLAQKAVSNLHDFGSIGLGAPMECTFQFHNDRPEVLEIHDVKLTAPLVVTRMTSRVLPGSNGTITVRLGEPRKQGEFKGAIVVNFAKEGVNPLIFWATGRLVPPIEFAPFPAFFVSAQRGKANVASLEITNHEPDAVEILNVLSTSSRFTTRLETLEPGRRYRLSLLVKADAPEGKESAIITVQTSSREHPFLEVNANVKVHERVYTFPDEISLEVNSLSLKARPQMADSFSEELTVYQTGGTDFRILSATTDVPFLRLTAYQAHLKDRFGVKIDVDPEKLKAGETSGSIVILTNDPEFPQVTVPVRAVVQADRQSTSDNRPYRKLRVCTMDSASP